MAYSFLQKGVNMGLNKENTEDYKKSVYEFQEKVKNMRIGYVPGVIRHYYHGSKKNRQYGERWKILVKHKYSPNEHIKYDKNGIIIPTEKFPKELIKEIYQYFQERNEDEMYKKN
jgi:hypothetical protein